LADATEGHRDGSITSTLMMLIVEPSFEWQHFASIAQISAFSGYPERQIVGRSAHSGL